MISRDDIEAFEANCEACAQSDMDWALCGGCGCCDSCCNCTVYVTHCPCSGCAKALIQAGIKKVVVGSATMSMPNDEFTAAWTMMREAGVTIETLA